MKINNQELNVDNLLKNINVKNEFLKDCGHGIFLSNDEEQVLNKYKINYKTCTSTSELIFIIEEYLNDSYLELDDLDNISRRLSEYNYYQNTNK